LDSTSNCDAEPFPLTGCELIEPLEARDKELLVAQKLAHYDPCNGEFVPDFAALRAHLRGLFGWDDAIIAGATWATIAQEIRTHTGKPVKYRSFETPETIFRSAQAVLELLDKADDLNAYKTALAMIEGSEPSTHRVADLPGDRDTIHRLVRALYRKINEQQHPWHGRSPLEYDPSEDPRKAVLEVQRWCLREMKPEDRQRLLAEIRAHTGQTVKTESPHASEKRQECESNEVPWNEADPAFYPNKNAVKDANEAGREHEIDELEHLTPDKLNKLLRKPGCRVRYMSRSREKQPRGRVHRGDWAAHIKTQIEMAKRGEQIIEERLRF
jgi:hypothetical protein